jgi:4-deoxy-L-threo-5-hexosulose-uronate ketol-isomerase
MTAAEVRDAFLLPDLFTPGELRLTLTDADRLAVGGAVPLSAMALPPIKAFGSSYFTERRELGVFNIGAPGLIHAGGRAYRAGRLDCLYIGMGNEDVTFEPAGDGPPIFYLVSAPAHHAYPTQLILSAEAECVQLGDTGHANCRRLRRYIHSGGVASCQLVMGLTELGPGGVWNTMPPHTHSRRSEVYLYFDIPEPEMVFHFLGQPSETRHVVVRNREAVVSPPWSMHCGAGTAPYRFVWAMAGENQQFDDMDAASPTAIR